VKSLQEYVALAQTNDNCAGWLRVIRQGESNQNDDAFTELYGGSHFEGFADHPRQRFTLPGGNYTTAAGAYQITESTWNDFTANFGQTQFTPDNQAACAIVAHRSRGGFRRRTRGEDPCGNSLGVQGLDLSRNPQASSGSAGNLRCLRRKARASPTRSSSRPQVLQVPPIPIP
jgi:hypothetical protein